MGLNIQKAIIFATLKHEGQKRKGTEIPYIVHPMEVMQILTEMNCNENTVIDDFSATIVDGSVTISGTVSDTTDITLYLTNSL
mgnify:CR=1 FL=1